MQLQQNARFGINKDYKYYLVDKYTACGIINMIIHRLIFLGADMRILIISDSHGKTENIEFLKGKVGKIDLVLHCGDGISDLDYIGDIFKCKAVGVSGNCDLFSREPSMVNLNIEGNMIHIEHGHRLAYRSDVDLISFAKDSGYDVVLFGHTHVQKFLNKDGVWVVNPGSISRPRDGYPSYCILEAEGKGKLVFKLLRL